MDKRIIVSCENPQEFFSLVSVLQGVSARIVYFDVMRFYSSANVVIPNDWERIRARQVFRGRLSDLGFLEKLLNYIFFTIQLLFLIFWLRPALLVVGTPLIFFRLQRWFSIGGVKVVSILRSVVYGPSSNVKVGCFNRFLMWSGLSGYSADFALCVGASTVNFARSQSFGEVFAVGPFDADNLLVKHPAYSLAYPGDYDVLVFIGAAYSWHGDSESEEDQSICLSDLKEHCARLGKRFIYLAHPRGAVSREIFSEFEVMQGGLPVCLDLIRANHGRVYFISMLSTMSFELSYLGGACCFYVTDGFLCKYSSWYSVQSNRAFTELSEIDFSRGHVNYDAVFETCYRGRVCDEASGIISGLLLR